MVKSAKMAFFAALGLFLASCAPKPALGPPVPQESDAAGRSSVEITVYNTGVGVVREVRAFTLPAGAGEMRFADVAEKIDPASVLVKTKGGSGGFSVAEQNFEYDLISHAKLLEKYVGRDIKLLDRNDWHGRASAVTAALESVSGGEVYRIGDSVYLGHPGIKVLPEIPGSLISRPTLSWLYESKAARRYELEVSYVTGGMNWEADYVLILPPDNDTAASLSGWVTIDNRSGASFEGAKLQLVAGEVNTVQSGSESREFAFEAPPFAEMAYLNDFGADVLMGAAIDRDFDRETAAPRFMRSGVFEYRMYDLQRPTTLKHNQKKQVNFMEAQGVRVEREYITGSDMEAVIYGSDEYNGYMAGEYSGGQTVAEALKIKNTEGNGLGIPLPAGTVRVFTCDSLGRQLIAGEDEIDHTPEGEEITVSTGGMFDIVAERALTGFKKKSGNVTETEWEITVRNRKGAGVNVIVEEYAECEWEINESTHEYTKVSAGTFRFNVAVDAGREAVVRYRITGVTEEQ
ncbi:MAG: hypothetical protein FWB85_06830 [Chitinispirillia bacterium]|nr:hypothetical protein [Chitinispirillia bacterium]MCL2241949.1 hypothetical protein [Chitinispirillia bacterium]